MAHFIEGLDRQQTMLLPEYLDDYVDENVRAIDAFVDFLDLAALGFNTLPAATGRPGYHPGLMPRIYVHGYLNQVQSSRRARSMATTARMPRIVGYNVQTAVEDDTHLIVAHEETMLDVHLGLQVCR